MTLFWNPVSVPSAPAMPLLVTPLVVFFTIRQRETVQVAAPATPHSTPVPLPSMVTDSRAAFVACSMRTPVRVLNEKFERVMCTSLLLPPSQPLPPLETTRSPSKLTRVRPADGAQKTPCVVLFLIVELMMW